tara:strand:- start:911 stop:1306 length:396 start_codon:yes stop_codon:yes gene_type:complete
MTDNEKKVSSWEVTFSADKKWASLKGQYLCGDSFKVRINDISVTSQIFAQISPVCTCADYDSECGLCTLDDSPLCIFDSCERLLSAPKFDSADETIKSLLDAAETAWYRHNVSRMDYYHPDGDIWDWGNEE